VFIHDALEELVTCGETDISAGNLRVKVNKLHKIIPGKAISGFEDQFKVGLMVMKLVSISLTLYGYGRLTALHMIVKYMQCEIVPVIIFTILPGSFLTV